MADESLRIWRTYVVLRFQRTRLDRDFQAVVEANAGLCGLGLRMYRSLIVKCGLGRDEAEATARIGLWQAATRYDPMAGAGFATFAFLTIRGAITGWLRRHLRYRHTSLDVPVVAEDGDTRPLVDLVADPAAECPDDLVIRRDLAAKMQALIDQHCDQREREVLRMRFQDGLQLQEIGNRLGVSKARIGQIIEEACATLRLEILPPAAAPTPSPYDQRQEAFRRHVARFLPVLGDGTCNMPASS